MGWLDELLSGREPRTPRLADDFPAELRSGGPALYTGPGSNGLEVLGCDAASRPTAAAVRRAHRARRGNRASPVLIAVRYPADDGEKVVLCGPDGEQAPVHHDIEPSVAGRICAAALDEPNHHAAVRLLRTTLNELDDLPLPGVRNQGLFATHVLRRDLPARPDWTEATAAANPMLAKRGRELVQALGYTVEALASGASMLTADGHNHAVAVFCAKTDTFESPSSLFYGSSPVAHAFALADQKRVPWVIVTRGAQIRLYAARPDTGVGRKGRAETYLELNLALLPADSAGYLTLNFSPAALSPEGAIEETLDASERYAADLAVRLRERVYDHTVPALASAVAARMAPNPTGEDLKAAYEAVMTILFRLLFVAYAEDKGLLPVATNSRYAAHSLTKITEQIIDARNTGQLPDADTEACHWWDDIAQLWEVVDRGKEAWGVPAYNGGLFSSDPGVSGAGAALANLRISDAELEPALEALLIDDTPEGIGPVDFRSLSVREFGTIYEGLLESHMVAAQTDLAEEGTRQYRPAKPGEPVAIAAGRVYFSHRSGVRKTTGSYFTPAFAVEHLLEKALEPALDAHVSRLDELRESGDEAKLAEAFFDFRCADIAMGSGHFLTAALDRIEARLSKWLTTYPVPGVSAELARLRQTAKDALADTDASFDVADTALLRRQVARRCIYGVDMNLVAVELARLAVWIHTFVPGLPLSFLDHNLVCGDSLVGVGTLEEAMAAFEAGTSGRSGTPSMFLQAKMEQVRPMLLRLARTADADAAEIANARQAHADALASLRDAGVIDLFNVITAHRAGLVDLPDISNDTAITARAARQEVIERVAELKPLHFPAAFPEVFLRDRPGFDCLIGNPPWEKVVVADKVWWGQYLPGIRSLAIQDMKAQIADLRRNRPDLDKEYEEADTDAASLRGLLRTTFPHMGSGDTDLSKAFAWRNWQLIHDGGYAGVVLPRNITRGKGSEKWRKEILKHGTFADVTTLSNKSGWVFEDVHQMYGVSLVTLNRTRVSARTVKLAGPFTDAESFAQASSESIPLAEFVTWSDDATFPDLPAHPKSLSLFRKLRQSPAVKDLSLSLSLSLSRRPSRSTSTDTRDRRPPRQGSAHLRLRSVSPVAEIHVTADRELLVYDSGTSAMNPDSRNWPVYGGRDINLWNPTANKDGCFASTDPDIYVPHLAKKRRNQARTKTSAFYGLPQETLDDPATLSCYKPRIVFRDVTRALDTRTIRAALIPPKHAPTYTIPYLEWPDAPPRAEAYLLGVLSSMICDWYARCVVELHMTFALFGNIPIPETNIDENPLAQRVIQIAGTLAAVDDRFADWAAEVGVPVGTATDANPEYKQALIEELDACVALLYGLDEDDLACLYETFHETTDYSARHQAVLAHFRRLAESQDQNGLTTPGEL